ncbi:6-phosphogluconolactonase [Calidifontibacter terrae]
MTDRQIIVEPDKRVLADRIAVELDQQIEAALEARQEAHISLTGGSMGQALVEAWVQLDHSDRDWTGVHLWWGDERFTPKGDADRNDQQAYDAGLRRLGVPADNIHSAPASDAVASAEEAATAYAAELAEYSETETGCLAEQPAVPTFDVMILGVGPDGHVASLFPQHPAQNVIETTTVAVHNSPKPPPNRISLTFPALNNCRELWLTVAGTDKAEALARAAAGEDPWAVPASAVHGQLKTVWWLDEAAAAQLPQH